VATPHETAEGKRGTRTIASCTEPDLDNQPLDFVYLVAAGKGGVGKSMMALVLSYQLLLRGKTGPGLRTDKSNADVWLCLEREGKNAPGEPIEGVTMHALDLALPAA
jgi:hypothetical protein